MIALRVQGDPASANNGLFFMYGDHLGSASLTTDASGVVIARQLYDAWGNIRSGGVGSMPTDITFTGQRSNLEQIGLYYFKARYYSSYLNRFVSADTIVPDGKNPQQFNRYSYTLNNPVKYTDPTGHDTDCAVGDAACRLMAKIESLTGAKVLGNWTPKELSYILDGILHMPPDARRTVNWIARLSECTTDSCKGDVYSFYWTTGLADKPFPGVGIAFYDGAFDAEKLAQIYGTNLGELSFRLNANHEFWHPLLFKDENGKDVPFGAMFTTPHGF